jgi:hypothetical protein
MISIHSTFRTAAISGAPANEYFPASMTATFLFDVMYYGVMMVGVYYFIKNIHKGIV